MNRRLLSGAALMLTVALTGTAGAFETGGQQVGSDFQISPLTSAIVQSAQARVFAGSTLQAAIASISAKKGNPPSTAHCTQSLWA